MQNHESTMPIRFCALLVLLISVPVSASAQVFLGSAKPRPGTVEVSGGALWTAGKDFGSAAATLTPNPSGGLSGFELFSTESTLKPAFGGIARVGVYITRALAIEGGFQFARPRFEVSIGDDSEGADDVVAETTITSYLFTGSLVYHFGDPRGLRPFVAAGGGHVRDVQNGSEIVDTGAEFHATAGIKTWFGRRRTLGLRAEAGLSVRNGGFTFDEDRRVVPMAAASLAYLF